jgi:hypothetical protein
VECRRAIGFGAVAIGLGCEQRANGGRIATLDRIDESGVGVKGDDERNRKCAHDR